MHKGWAKWTCGVEESLITDSYKTVFVCYRTRIWVLVEVAPPQSGTVESEDSLPQVTWPPSLKVYSKCKSRESLLNTSSSCFSLDFTIHLELSSASIFNCLQIATVFVWSLTAFQIVEERTCQRECSIPSGCPSMRSTTSFYMTYWMVPTACSWKRGSRCVLVTTSRETRMWKVTASWIFMFHRNWPSFCTRSTLAYCLYLNIKKVASAKHIPLSICSTRPDVDPGPQRRGSLEGSESWPSQSELCQHAP